MYFLNALLIAVGLASCSPPNVVEYDRGGVVYKRLYEISQWQRPIKIKGFCASSCTYVFTYKDTCVFDEAKLLFHAPKNPDGTISDVWFKEMKESYPEPLRSWFDQTLDGKDYVFSGLEMQKLFNIKRCEQ